MGSTRHFVSVDLPRFTVEVSEFTVLSQIGDRGSSQPRAEFAFVGRVGTEGPEADFFVGEEAHPLLGRKLSVSFAGGKECAEDGTLGWIQFAPNAPEIAAAARIVCCPRRVASLRATAHHASGPLGGRLELVLEVAPAEDTGGGPVVRIPIRNAVIRATRRFGNEPGFTECLDGTDPQDAGSVQAASAVRAGIGA